MIIMYRFFLMAALIFPVFELHCSDYISEELTTKHGSGCKRSPDISLEDLEHGGLELHNGAEDLFNLDYFLDQEENLFDDFAEYELNDHRKRSAEYLLPDLLLGKKFHKKEQDESLMESGNVVDDLPFEVWLNIAAYLDKMPDLAALAQTSRLLNNVVSDLSTNPKDLGMFLKAVVAPGRGKSILTNIFVMDHNLLSVKGCALFCKNYGNKMSSLAIKLRGAVSQNYKKLQEQLLAIDPGVTDLDCSDLKIKFLPPQIFSFKNLKQLVLTNTSLLILPSSIANLASLEELSLDKTEIDKIPPEIANLERLSVLDLSNTKLRSIPDEVLNGRKIEDFHIYDTPYSNAMTRSFIRNLLF